MEFPEWYYDMLEMLCERCGANEKIAAIIYMSPPVVRDIRKILFDYKEPRRNQNPVVLAKEALSNMAGHRILSRNQKVNGCKVTKQSSIFYIEKGGFTLT